MHNYYGRGYRAVLGAVTGILFLASCQSAAQAEGAGAAQFKRGVAEYERNDFDGAAKLFNSALVADRSNPVYHYYFANTLARNGRYEEAVREYQIASRLTHDPTLRSYCLAALSAAGGGTGLVQQQQLARLHDPNEIGHAMYNIDKEQSLEAMRINSSDIEANNRLNDGNMRAQQAQQVANSQATMMQNSYTRTRSGARIPNYSAADIQYVRDQGNAQAAQIQQLAQQQAAAMKQQALDHAQAMSDSALSLESQLQNPGDNLPGATMHLVPTGTNLFVRNYASEGPATSPSAESAMRADQLQLRAPGASGQKNQKGEKGSLLPGEKNVHAKVIGR